MIKEETDGYILSRNGRDGAVEAGAGHAGQLIADANHSTPCARAR